ncbi:hypothetical protein CF326_g5935 [Tilletia indica]|nr:hypothetical protein CF326_g5935 [Tilletia indica]
MVDTLQVVSLQPIQSSLPPQIIAYLSTDSFKITLGGTFSSARESPFPRVPVPSFRFDQQHLHHNHSAISFHLGEVHITANAKDNIIWVNQREVEEGETIRLHHGDALDVGHYNDYQECVEVELSLRVLFTSTPPAFVLADALLPTTATTLDHIHTLTTNTAQLREELHLVKQRLQDALDAAAEHTCVPPTPPRPYGTLLTDLRARAEDPNSSSSARPFTPPALSASDSSISSRSSPSLNDSQPSSVRSSASASTSARSPIPHQHAASVVTPSSLFQVSSSVPIPSAASTSATTSSPPSVLWPEAAPSSTATLSTQSPPPSTPSSISESTSSSLPTTPSSTSSPSSALTLVLGPVPPSTSMSGSVSSSIPSQKSLYPSTSSSTSVLRSGTSFSSPSTSSPSTSHADLELGDCSLTPSPPVITPQLSAPPLRSSCSARVRFSPTSAHFEATLGRVRSAWVSARQRLEVATAPGRRASLCSSAAGSIEIALSRVRMEWMRTRADLLDGADLLTGICPAALDLSAPADQPSTTSADAPPPTVSSSAASPPSMFLPSNTLVLTSVLPSASSPPTSPLRAAPSPVTSRSASTPASSTSCAGSVSTHSFSSQRSGTLDGLRRPLPSLMRQSVLPFSSLFPAAPTGIFSSYACFLPSLDAPTHLHATRFR